MQTKEQKAAYRKMYRSRPEVRQKIAEYQKKYHVEYSKKYYQRPEVKARVRAYRQLPEVKAKRAAYARLPKTRAWHAEHYHKPEVQARKREYLLRPDVRARISSYRQRTAVKERLQEYRKQNMDKRRAQDNALRRIPDVQPCSIKGCELLGERHHYDYSKPLDIVWLCRKHHKIAHSKRQRVCSICLQPHYAKGFCRNHYTKNLRGNSALKQEEQ